MMIALWSLMDGVKRMKSEGILKAKTKFQIIYDELKRLQKDIDITRDHVNTCIEKMEILKKRFINLRWEVHDRIDSITGGKK